MLTCYRERSIIERWAYCVCSEKVLYAECPIIFLYTPRSVAQRKVSMPLQHPSIHNFGWAMTPDLLYKISRSKTTHWAYALSASAWTQHPLESQSATEMYSNSDGIYLRLRQTSKLRTCNLLSSCREDEVPRDFLVSALSSCRLGAFKALFFPPSSAQLGLCPPDYCPFSLTKWWKLAIRLCLVCGKHVYLHPRKLVHTLTRPAMITSSKESLKKRELKTTACVDANAVNSSLFCFCLKSHYIPV